MINNLHNHYYKPTTLKEKVSFHFFKRRRKRFLKRCLKKYKNTPVVKVVNEIE